MRLPRKRPFQATNLRDHDIEVPLGVRPNAMSQVLTREESAMATDQSKKRP